MTLRLPPSPRRARGPAEHAEALEVRLRVFCDEQGVDRGAEIDGLDDPDGGAIHIVSMERGKVIATCRLRPEGGHGGTCKLERMAIEAEHRGIGLGRALITKSEEEAKREGAAQMLLHSQTQARGFYERSGYRALDEEIFMEDGIEHLRMGKEL